MQYFATQNRIAVVKTNTTTLTSVYTMIDDRFHVNKPLSQLVALVVNTSIV